MNTTTLRLLTIGIAATLIGQAATAAAPAKSAADEALTYLVRYPDLDLSKIEGARALYTRLNHAARDVCRPFESREMGIAEKYRACMDKAVGDAVASVNRPLLSQLHQSHAKSDKNGLVQLAKAN